MGKKNIHQKIADIIIKLLLIANFAIVIWYCFDPSFMDKLEDNTRMTIALSMVYSWGIIGGFALGAKQSK
jgi:hypothetical protein